jgi:L-lactate dehydrogenase (cytochrome)
MTLISFEDYRARARRRLPHFLFEYADGGAYDEVTLHRNVADLKAVPLRLRVLRDVAAIDTSVDLFGARHALPVTLAPVGLAGLYHRRGEVQAARAAAAAGISFCLSTMSVCPLDEVAGASSRPLWFQLYMTRDRGFMRDLLENAAALGCNALVFTVDLPVAGVRYRDYRSGLAGAQGLGARLRRFAQVAARPGWAWNVGLCGRPHHLGNIAPVLAGRSGLEDFFGWIGANFDAGVTWSDLDFIRESWPGPLILKGILDADDAREAVAIGADGIVVSNHGGRQLDGAPSSARALPGVADAVGGKLRVLVDGGVRSGLDIVRMLALGADSVLIGRPWLYALASGGGPEVERLLRRMEAELRVAMALTGCKNIADIDLNALARI